MKNEIEELFANYKIRTIAMETVDSAMAQYMINSLGYEAVVYGGGRIGLATVRYLKDVLNIVPKYVLDVNPTVDCIENVPVYSLDIIKDYGNKIVCFIATASFYSEEENMKILKYLYRWKDIKIINFMPVVKAVIDVDFYSYIVKNRDVFIKQYELFEDRVSKETYKEYIRAFLEGDYYRNIVYAEQNKYFGTEENGLIFNLEEGSVWVNVGSCRGDTLYHYLNHNLPFYFGKIYAVEGDNKMSEILRKNVSYMPQDVCEKIEIVDKYCGMGEGCIRIDDFVKEEKVGLINMDIEGAELDAIESARNHIINNRPVLAICAYHKASDLLEIPNKINGMVLGYRFFLRKYVSGIGTRWQIINRMNELVLYAVPVEKIVYCDM